MVTFSVTPGADASLCCGDGVAASGPGRNECDGGRQLHCQQQRRALGAVLRNERARALSYQAVGQPGTYPARATWSVDGVGGGEAVGTSIVVASGPGSGFPTAPTQVGTPVFTPASGNNVPVSLTISCPTPGAVIYYTLDGSLPTQASTLYTGTVYLASASTVRAVGFTNSWTPSVASVAYYGPPAATANAQVLRSVNTNMPNAPVVTFSVAPGANAACVAVTEWLPLGVARNGCDSGRQLPREQQRGAVGAVLRHERARAQLSGGRPAGNLSSARVVERGRCGRW